jgi:ElaB/YqjD/DUF883 family membrane-anchored ribosome-binding protein
MEWSFQKKEQAMAEAMTPSDIMQSGDRTALKEKAVAAKEAVVDLASEAKHYAAGRVGDMKDTATGWMLQAKSKAGQISDRTVKHVQRHPYRSLALAAGIGFVAGMLLKRR